MGMMDGVKGKMSDMSDEKRERMEMLTSKAKEGTLTDSERAEYEQMQRDYGSHTESGQ